MHWDAIAAIGQVVSAFAFILAIIQIRQVRSESQRAIGRERADRVTQINVVAATNERLATLRAKVNQILRSGEPPRHPFFRVAIEKAGVTEAEAFMLYSDQMSRWGGMTQVLSYKAELPAGEREQIDSINRQSIREPLFQLWYDTMRPALTPELVAYIDSLQSQNASATA